MAASDFDVFVLNTVALGDQLRPDLTQLNNGNILVVWDSGNEGFNAGYSDKVLGAIFDRDGRKVVADFLVNQNDEERNLAPEVTTLAGGGFVVSWQTVDSVLARLFDASGQPVGSEFEIADQSSGIAIDLAPLAGGGFVATYRKSSGLAARVFDDGGVATGPEFQVDPVLFHGTGGPSVLELSSGKLMFVWEDADSFKIRGRIFDDDGDAVTTAFDVSEAPLPLPGQWPYGPRMAEFDNGNVIVVWSDGQDIKARVFDPSGNEVVSEFQVNVWDGEYGAAGYSWAPDVLVLADGGFLVAWPSSGFANNNASLSNAHARVFNADGSERVPEFDVAERSEFQDLNSMRLAELDDGRIMLVWEQRAANGDGSGSAIEGRIFYLPSYDYETGRFVTVGSGDADDVNGVLIQDAGQDDLVVALDGDDTVEAGDGNDIVYGDSTNPASAAIAARTINGLDSNVLLEGNGADTLLGGGGNDKLFGGNGKDSLSGGSGKDSLEGDGSGDRFIFDLAPGKEAGIDKLGDFSRKQGDKICLFDDAFDGIGKKLSKDEFVVNKRAEDPYDRIIFAPGKKASKVFYDADGRDGDKQVLFLKLDANVDLTHKDFKVMDLAI